MTPDEVFAAWVDDVRRRGNVPTVFPSGVYAGRKAERTHDGKYLAPPPEVRAVEDAVRLQERQDIAAGERLQILQDALVDAAKWVARLPRRIVEETLGWPPWVIPVGALALAVFLVNQWGRRPGSP